jgi:uncharacterized SAM-binding protein YcdF (DUF218 family)
MKKSLSKYLVRLGVVAFFWLIFVAVPSISVVRCFLAAPLVVTDENARGDLCYVLADGIATWERLAAASDLYHLKRIKRITIMEDDMTGPYNFKAKSSWTETQWEIAYLAWRGVPADKVDLLKPVEGLFGTLSEARNVARHLPSGTKTIVLVSSAPHMRRSMLAFRRSLPPDIKILPYAATSFKQSYEMTLPIWLEYLKLLVYYVVA